MLTHWNNHIDVRTMEIGLGVDAGHPPTNEGDVFNPISFERCPG